MNNPEVARILALIAKMMELAGENRFKTAAYQRAAETIAQLSFSIETAARNDELLNIPGIGKGIAAEITGILTTGESSTLKELTRTYPLSLLELVDISGLGPKKALLLYREAGIASLEDLERALRGGLLKTMKGFGEKSEENIRRGVELKRFRLSQISIGTALPTARNLIRVIESIPGVSRVSETGDLRRRKETVPGIEIIAASLTPGETASQSLDLHLLENPVITENPASSSFIVEADLSGGLKVSLLFLPPENFSAVLIETTGTDEHVKALRKSLENSGYRLNSYRFGYADGRPVEVREESDIYEKAHLPWIPPELRETGDEVEAYKGKVMPVLVSRGDIRGDLQMHSHFSDGTVSIRSMTERAIELGYSYIAITDHSPSLTIARGVSPERLKEQHEEIDKLNREFDGRFKILKSAEVDIKSDGTLDYPDEILENLDFVLASVHSRMKMEREEITERIIKAIRHPLVHCLAHPSGRLIGRRAEMDIDWNRVFAAAAETGTAMEINSHPSRLDLNDTRAKQARDMGIPIFVNTDAHSPEELDLIEYGIYTARRAELTPGDILNTLPLEELEAGLSEIRDRKS